jgi:hypothetical protein
VYFRNPKIKVATTKLQRRYFKGFLNKLSSEDNRAVCMDGNKRQTIAIEAMVRPCLERI